MGRQNISIRNGMSFTVLSCCFFLAHVNCALRLGAHSKPARGVTVLPGTYPNPIVFYKHFVSKGEPLLMKDVLADSENKAYNKWTDDYLRKTFGDEFVHVERGKKEDRGRDISSVRLWKYLDVYLDIDLYMVYSASHDMQEDIEVPFTLQCGGFQDNLHDSVVWFSGGDTKSVLHYDAADNILCSLDGTKQVVLIDKKYEDQVKAGGFVEEGAYSKVDVDNVDEKKFSQLLAVPWIQVNITKGDCLFIPYKWFHHVYSPPGRNLAVNMWFSHLWWFNETACKGVVRDTTPSKPLSKFELASPNEQLRTEVLEPFESMETVTHDDFMKHMACEDEGDSQKIWGIIDTDSDNVLSWPEMYQFNMDDVVYEFPQCFLKPVQTEETAVIDEGEDSEQDKVDLKNEQEKLDAEIYRLKKEKLQQELNTKVKNVLEANIAMENQFVIDGIEEEMFDHFEVESDPKDVEKDSEDLGKAPDVESVDVDITGRRDTQKTTDKEDGVEEGSETATEKEKVTESEKTMSNNVHDEF